jgi:hypothetical protein
VRPKKGGLHPGLGGWRKCAHTHVLLAKVNELVVVEVEVALNLKDGGLDASAVQVALDLLLWKTRWRCGPVTGCGVVGNEGRRS